jgi:hypothetical protein
MSDLSMNMVFDSRLREMNQLPWRGNLGYTPPPRGRVWDRKEKTEATRIWNLALQAI